jgi:hypothetical protein
MRITDAGGHTLLSQKPVGGVIAGVSDFADSERISTFHKPIGYES